MEELRSHRKMSVAIETHFEYSPRKLEYTFSCDNVR